MAFPFASTLDFLLRRGARQVNDASTARELNADNASLALPKGLTLEWLGTAGFAIGYEGHTVLIDPYLTRPGVRAVLGRSALRPDRGLIERYVPSADAILVGHTHFDHALDIPAIAEARQCPVYGSSSSANLLRGMGQSERAVEVEPGRVYEIGPFAVTFIESLHSRLLLGLAVPHDGELTCDHLDGLHGGQYRCGQVYAIHVAVAGVTFYHQGSANLIEDRIQHRHVDYLLAGIAGRGFTRNYTERILRAVEPRIVIPHHFDDFFRPLDGEFGFSLNVNLGGFVEEVERVSSDFEVRTLSPLRRVSGGEGRALRA